MTNCAKLLASNGDIMDCSPLYLWPHLPKQRRQFRVVGSFELGLETNIYFLGLGGMNRVELIKSLVRKERPAEAPKAKGVFLAATPEAKQVLSNRPKDRKRGLGVLLRGNWGSMNCPAGLKCNWVQSPDQTHQTTCFKTGFRHQPHALASIAHKLKRSHIGPG